METIALEQTCSILSGYAFKSKEYVSKGIRIIRIANVQKGYIEDKLPCYYPCDNKQASSDYALVRDDLLVSLTGNVGRVGLMPDNLLPAALNQRVACLRVKEDSPLTKEFIYAVLNSDQFEQEAIESSNGVAQKNLSVNWLKQYQLPLIAKTEQASFCKRFSIIDSNCSRTRTITRKLDDLIKSRFIEMFGDPNHSHSHNAVYLEDAFDVRDDLRKPLNSKTRSDMKAGELYPYYGANGIVDFINAFITDCDALCFAEDCGSYGADEQSTYIVRGKAWVNNHAHFLLAKPCCILEWANVYFYLLDIGKMISGTTRSKLTQAQLKRIMVDLPPLALQQEFADFVSQVDKLRFETQQQIEKLETLKKSLMQKYFG